ncbi:MAG: tetratricopeptide repeat protein [Ignavibacteriae bacterium]|nr:tetratricopeptide repeat protein [Ignavibacteriota bacterium]
MALDPLEKAVQIDPQHDFSQFLLGCALGRLGKFARALSHLQIADQLRPNNPEITRNIGWMMCMQGNFKEGRTLLRRAIKLYPKNALAYNDLGASYLFGEDIDIDLAERWFKKALEIDPDNAFIQSTYASFKELTRGIKKKRRG